VPAWLNESLRYAPLAAMAAVVLPEILMNKGQLVTTMLDARIIAALAAAACFFWRRTLLGTIITGMAVLLPLRLVLGW
jgi:branched-subunit amino acid transport protein